MTTVNAIPAQLAYAIDQAGAKSGVDFDYLVQTAIRESSLDPAARARTSTATGLFQFIESTWLEVMKTEGPRLGYQDFADDIHEQEGAFFVPNPARRAEILALREDPQISSDLAAAFTRRNGDYLHGRFGRMPSPGELYIAHFLGAAGAERFFTAGLSNPEGIAADLLPRPAAANRAIFYDNGRPRTVREVYQVLVARHNGPAATAPSAGFAAQQMASEPIPSRFETMPPLPPGVSFTSLFSTSAGGAAGTPVQAPGPADETPLFQGFYTR